MTTTSTPKTKKKSGTAAASKISTHLRTQKEERSLKSNARVKIASKTDLIRKYIQQGMTATQIKAKLEKMGLSIYPSEIYRVMS